ncbi:MAG: matrixin family metalloprotease, partial [Isosphaeraceae bacterium]
RKAVTPLLEGLERRELLYSTLGGSFTHGSRITYSFVPDGTNIGGLSSNLYATLNAVAPTATWQTAFSRAAAIWSSYANINMVQVSDNGAPLGAAGNQQGDGQFGDIRISMTPQASGILGTALLPPPFNGGSAAGDISLNSNVSWAINANYDLQTVAIHEIGHALGVGHSTITSAVMYAYYNNVKQSLTADDIAGIQAVYGAYPADPINDGTFATATNLTSLIDSNGQVALGGRSLAGGGDLDFYSITVPANTNGTMTISMQSTNLSSVSPRLTVYNGSQAGIGMTSLPNSFGATATFTVSGVTPGQTYYFRASAASAFGSYGAYGMLVNFGSASQAPIAPPNTTVTAQPDQGGGSINVELVQIGHFEGYGEQLTGTLPTAGNTAPRLDPNGWSIFLAGMTFLSAESATKAGTLLEGVDPSNWDAVLDAAIHAWGDTESLLRILKDLRKASKK